LRFVAVDKGTQKLVNVKALLLRIFHPVKLRPEQVCWNIKFDTNARTVTSVPPPEGGIVRRCAEASETNFVATLLYHAVENGLGYDL
jgi:hypothetical protein